MSKAKTTITVQRMAMAGSLSNQYRITSIRGSADIHINGIVKDAPNKTFRAGDTCDHEELKRLHDNGTYDITTKAPAEQ